MSNLNFEKEFSNVIHNELDKNKETIKIDIDDLNRDYTFREKIIDFVIDFPKNIKNYFKNLIKTIKYHIHFHSALKDYHPYDFSYDIKVLRKLYEIKLDYWKNHQIYEGQEKDTKDLKIFLECLKRLEEDDFIFQKNGDNIRKEIHRLCIKKFKKVLLYWM